MSQVARFAMWNIDCRPPRFWKKLSTEKLSTAWNEPRLSCWIVMKTNSHIGVHWIFWTTYFCKFVLIVTIIYNIWYISLYFDVHFLQERFFIFQPVSIRLAAFPDVLLSPFRSLRSGRLLLLHQAQWGPSLVSMPRALLQRGLCTWPERASVTAAGLRSRPNPNFLVSM